MPVQFLSEADHHRLSTCPSVVTQDDLDTYFQLNSEDLHGIRRLRGEANRLGFALQLCCLRFLGFFPADLHTIAEEIASYVNDQLSVNPYVLAEYGSRGATVHEHQQQSLVHLNYRRATPVDLLALDAWLLERALEHDRPKHIFDLASDYLRHQRIVRPGSTRLAQLVGQARNHAQHVAFERLQPFLTSERRAFLDKLLEVGTSGHTHLVWLQRTPRSNQTRDLVQTLDKIAFLQEHGVGTCDLSALTTNRRKWLTKKCSRARADNLGNLQNQARYPQLAAFAEDALYTFTDALLEMLDARLWELHSDCRNEFKKDRLAASRTINETMHVLSVLGRLYLNASLGDAPTDGEPKPSEEEVRLALKNAEQLIRPEDDAYIDYFAKKHRQVQNFSKRLLDVMTFYRSSADGGLLEGLKLINEIHTGVRHKLPMDAPTSFIPAVWIPEVFAEGGLDWHSYEIAAIWVLREKLRSGDVYVPHSRRYVQLERFLIPKASWQEERKDVWATG